MRSKGTDASFAPLLPICIAGSARTSINDATLIFVAASWELPRLSGLYSA